MRTRLPRGRSTSPLRAIARRLGIALALVLVAWGMVVFERGDYSDSLDGEVSVLDALYYTTVTLTTTGYGDIVPVTTSARLLNTFVVTPMRILFVIVLVGTTIQALTERSRTEIRLARWRSRMREHVIVLGYGTKGRSAVRQLCMHGHPKGRVVVVDSDPRATADAAQEGYVSVTGDATRSATFRAALIDRAARVVVALDRDDAAILATLAVRRLNPRVTVVAAAREAEHAELLRESGASSVVVSSETAGRLLGMATDSPAAVDVVEDLVSFGTGLDLAEREVHAGEVGRSPESFDVPVLAVVRDGRPYRYGDPDVATLRAGDRLLYVVAG
ncbi:NAD-binding protein [Paenibacillus sp. TRM 82003]|uniref:potassium channel family protein n=1 Tax=Kineococcus sp. TRM81007 TaxID=2925831 RepID=UPI001F5983BC|nr:NAD(P)-binding protein [Kineococcus sp. TRM81007]MCI2239938.1 NAD-binding protein [Kineococcus sp. TRM81007]MCI3925757.1 NAD-binding protein [Paenibacillus sp. TRM 82003]